MGQEEIKVDSSLVKVEPEDKKLVQSNNTAFKNEDEMVNSMIYKSANSAADVKDVINLAATKKALEDENTVKKIVSEKTEELQHDAEAKKVEAETSKIRRETEKVKQEMERELAALEKQKKELEAEVSKLRELDNKAQAYFDANKSILKCIGVREKLSLKAMQWLMIPASIVFTIFQILLLPFSLVGFGIESIMNIVDAVCGKIAKGGLKIALSVISLAVVLGLVGGIYYLVIYLTGKL